MALPEDYALYSREGPVPLALLDMALQKVLLFSHGNALPSRLLSLCNGSSYSAPPTCLHLGLQLLTQFN